MQAAVCIVFAGLTALVSGGCASPGATSGGLPFEVHPNRAVEVTYRHHERAEVMSVRSGPAADGTRRQQLNQKTVAPENMQILLDNLLRIGFFASATSGTPAGKASLSVDVEGTSWRIGSSGRSEADLARFYDCLNVLRALYNQTSVFEAVGTGTQQNRSVRSATSGPDQPSSGGR